MPIKALYRQQVNTSEARICTVKSQKVDEKNMFEKPFFQSYFC
jgi:hypothetical protein